MSPIPLSLGLWILFRRPDQVEEISKRRWRLWAGYRIRLANAGFITIATFDRLPDNMEVHTMMCYTRLVDTTGEAMLQRRLPEITLWGSSGNKR